MAKQRNPKGMGHYKKKKDGRCEWVQTVDGQTRYLSAKTMSELKEKTKKVADLPIIKEKYKTSDWFDRWLEVYIKPLKKTATYQQYKILYEKHIQPVIGNRKLTDLKSFDIQTVIAKANEKGLASKTMTHLRGIMNIALSKALKDKVIPSNPVQEIEIPVKQAKPRKTLTPQELAKLFKSMKGSRWIHSIQFALVTGIRRGELLALKWSDIDFKNRKITIDESNSLDGVGDTKSSKIRVIPLCNKAVNCLEAQKEQLRKENNQNKELVFPSIDGKMLFPNSYYTLVARFAKKAGIHASPHCLRHTFVYLTRGTLTLKDIQNILGHDESTTTLDIYGDMINESTKETASQIDEVFNKVDVEIKKIKRESPSHLRRVK